MEFSFKNIDVAFEFKKWYGFSITKPIQQLSTFEFKNYSGFIFKDATKFNFTKRRAG